MCEICGDEILHKNWCPVGGDSWNTSKVECAVCGVNESDEGITIIHIKGSKEEYICSECLENLEIEKLLDLVQCETVRELLESNGVKIEEITQKWERSLWGSENDIDRWDSMM